MAGGPPELDNCEWVCVFPFDYTVTKHTDPNKSMCDQPHVVQIGGEQSLVFEVYYAADDVMNLAPGEYGYTPGNPEDPRIFLVP